MLTEIVDTHKNLLMTSQNVIANALNDEGLDVFKKANVALRFLNLSKGKEDIFNKDKDKLIDHLLYTEF